MNRLDLFYGCEMTQIPTRDPQVTVPQGVLDRHDRNPLLRKFKSKRVSERMRIRALFDPDFSSQSGQ